MIYDKIYNWRAYFKDNKVFRDIFKKLSLVDDKTETLNVTVRAQVGI